MKAPIPVIEARGSHRAIGEAIGEGCRTSLGAVLDRARDEVGTAGWEALIAEAGPYEAAARRAIPHVIDELEGCAAGSGLPVAWLMAYATEELWSDRGGCTDVAATAPATAGETLLAHTNDLSPTTETQLVAIDRRPDGEPRSFGIGVGPFVSAGLNEAGICLGGNQLDATDERVGVPRLLLVRALLAKRTAASAIAAVLHPDRASSYNDVIGAPDGTLVSVEASATAAVVVDAADGDGTLAHTNHYTAPMLGHLERDLPGCAGSRARLARARALLAGRDRPVDRELLRAILADHDGPEPICRHAGSSRTVFWCLMDAGGRTIEYGRGRPCEPGSQLFSLA